MADDDSTKAGPGRHLGPAHSSPYPLSRLAPPISLVDMAKEIQRADEVIGSATSAKLHIVAEQMRSLQAQARAILEDARRAADLHRARCNFKKRVGFVYHLYRGSDGAPYFSMLTPDDWNGAPPDVYEGSFRLEGDMSWTPAERLSARVRDDEVVRGLLAAAADDGGDGAA